MKILISMRQLGTRGTDHGSRRAATELARRGHRIAVCFPRFRVIDPVTEAYFHGIAEVMLPYDDNGQVQDFVNTWRPDLWYEKRGKRDWLPANVKTAVHAVFEMEPQGDRFAAISHWLGAVMNCPWVPSAVTFYDLPPVSIETRFGRHGGPESFDLDFARRAIHGRTDVAFLNTDGYSHEVISDPHELAVWVSKRGAMLHARARGETYGHACAEFAIQRKPVLTWDGSREKAHYELLGPAAVFYHDEHELLDLLANFKPEPVKGVIPYMEFTPERVVDKWEEVFLG